MKFKNLFLVLLISLLLVGCAQEVVETPELSEEPVVEEPVEETVEEEEIEFQYIRPHVTDVNLCAGAEEGFPEDCVEFCPEGLEPWVLPTGEFVCTDPNPCEWYECEEGTQCIEHPLEEDPGRTHPQVNCEETEEEPEEIIIIGPEGETHTVEAITKGFSPEELTIKVGDTVKWNVVRSGRLNKAMILGTINCLNIKSEILNTGDSFSWTFNEPQNCTFVDGITTSYLFKLKVVE